MNIFSKIRDIIDRRKAVNDIYDDIQNLNEVLLEKRIEIFSTIEAPRVSNSLSLSFEKSYSIYYLVLFKVWFILGFVLIVANEQVYVQFLNCIYAMLYAVFNFLKLKKRDSYSIVAKEIIKFLRLYKYTQILE